MMRENKPFGGTYNNDYNHLDRTSVESSHFDNEIDIEYPPGHQQERISFFKFSASLGS